MEQTTSPAADRDWARIAYWLVLATLGYNIVEAVVALWAGISADSTALVGFGLDSIIESLAAGVLLWRVTIESNGASRGQIQSAEHRVHRFVGYTFFALSIYILIRSILALIHKIAPSESVVGIIIAALSLFIMPGLAMYKFRAADRLGSRALRSEAKETLACSYLSFTLLLGLLLNAIFGYWWADPVAALLMVPWLVKEGFEGFEEEDE